MYIPVLTLLLVRIQLPDNDFYIDELPWQGNTSLEPEEILFWRHVLSGLRHIKLSGYFISTIRKIRHKHGSVLGNQYSNFHL